MENKLAIIIPAYKPTFLCQALNSIANQTDKRFNLYIGDDCSPYDLKSIVDKFKDKTPLTYHRFDTNLGGKDLVAQWERCIALSKDEEYIWLFSDDDEMDSNCVESFYNYVSENKDANVYHFNVDVIGIQGKIIKSSVYPQFITGRDLYVGKVNFSLDCYVVEFIFKRSVYREYNGFVKFDLAWGSDLATWVRFGENKGIPTIENAKVRWRSSGINISTTMDAKVLQRKADALVEFFKWGEEIFPDKYIHIANIEGFIKRIVNMSGLRGYSFALPYIKKFTRNKLELIGVQAIYTSYYCAKYLIKNVFRRNKP